MGRFRGGEGGQTMPLILGIVLLVSLGTVMLTQDTFQQFPIVTKDVIEHQAYRAMESGLDEYLYEVNNNADFAACNATFVTGGTTTTSTLTSASSVCSGLSFGSWTTVPGSSSTNGPPAFFLIDNPSINTSTGVLSIDIAGAAGYSNDYNYQTAVVTLQPLNSFLLNVLWMNYDQMDPSVVDQYQGNDPTCDYYWAPTPDGLANNCVAIEFVAADTLTGNLFVNDSVFVCGSANFQNVQTDDPDQNYVQLCSATLTSKLNSGSKYSTLSVSALPYAVTSGDAIVISNGTNTQTVTASAAALSGATSISVTQFTANATYQTTNTNVTDAPTVTGTWTNNVAKQPIPTDNTSLMDEAQENGCYYEGPTTIVLNGTTMNVTSYGTPTGKPTGYGTGSVSNDSLNDPANTANVCMPTSQGGSVSLPANGVVYVGECTSQTNGCNNDGGGTQAQINPLSNAGDTGGSGTIQGDAIVQGSLSSPLTIGSANNIVIDGNLCYTDTMSSGKCTTNAPAAPSTDVLGLVADNYVEINHPVSGSNNASLCGSSPYTSPTSGAVTCDLENPIIDAVVLALGHSFVVNNYTTGSSLGTINLFGSIDQDWRGAVATINSGGGVQTGYAKNYQYDGRLIYLSPPYYLSPGTSQWGFASFTDAAGQCKTASGKYPSACTGYP